MSKIRENSAEQAPLVSVIVVNWNGRAYLPDCLESLARQSFRSFEIILVDNGSCDDSVPFVTEHFPWVHLVILEENQGFAVGNNRGLERARGEYIVTLNNDTKADPNWLKFLVEATEVRPTIGMTGSRICSFDDPDRIDSLGMVVCRDGMARGRYRNRLWSRLQLPATEAILLPSACAALYRRKMLDETGFFDEDFFAYAEDTDLGLRGRLLGWEAVLATRAVVYHKYSMTGGSFSPFKVHLVERNHYWVVLKNFPLGYLTTLPWATLARYIVQGRAILQRRGTGREFQESGERLPIVWALLRGLVEALFRSPGMFRKRRHIMRNRRVPMQAMRRLLRQHQIDFRELLDDVPAGGERQS